MEKQPITIKIFGKPYPIAIRPELEKDVREAAALLNERLNKRYNEYDISQEDALCMVLLDEEYALVEARKQNEGKCKELLDGLKDIDGKLGEYLLSR